MNRSVQRALHPKNLIIDFGPKTELAQKAIHTLYYALHRSRHREILDLYEQWKYYFVRTTDFQAWIERISKRPSYKKFVAGFGLDQERTDPAKFSYVLQTYYALLIKLLSILVISPLSKNRSSTLLDIASKQGGKLQAVLAEMEHGKLFSDLGIRRFWEDDFFHWYVLTWDSDLEESLNAIIQRVANYNSTSVKTCPETCRDILKKLYHHLIPQDIRYYLGEYYTPDWLAEHLLHQTLGDDLGNPEKRILDPSCGSGTFLVNTIRHIREKAKEKDTPSKETLQLIVKNIVGYDLNPLAVLAARANYLFALGDLLQSRTGPIEIPIFLHDSIHPAIPSEEETVTALNSFHYVVGNPPWINWEYLPEDYRRLTIPLWQEYGLFPKRGKGIDTILGGAKYDFSMLMTCIALDRYLCHDGKLGFVITESLFKTTEAGQGFRRFMLPGDVPFKPLLVENMVDLQPFEKALNRTAIAIFQKGEKVSYPVPYTYWSKIDIPGRVRIDFNVPYHKFPYEKVVIRQWEALPVDINNPLSIWITGRPNAIKAFPKLLGESSYQAREGINTGGANGVYWMTTNGENISGLIKVTNLVESSKRSISKITTGIEPDLLYPLLRAGNVKRWNARPNAQILITHEPDSHLNAIPEPYMKQHYPRAFAYLLQFENYLRSRKTQVVQNLMNRGPFYSLFGIGEYSFAPWKVVWTRIAKVEAVVIGQKNNKIIMPQETLTMVACQSEEEAHYLAATINSTPFQFIINAYSQRGGKSMGSKHILKYVHIPKFSEKTPLHIQLAQCSKNAHERAKNANSTKNDDAILANAGYTNPGFADLEEQLDQLTAQLWNLSELELIEIRESFLEI